MSWLKATSFTVRYTSRMVDILIDFFDFLIRPIKWLWRMIWPQPEYLSPYQGAGLDDRSLSWWHVPVTIWNFGYIKDATIWLIPQWSESPTINGIPLRWQSRDSVNGVAKETIRQGERINIPIAIRVHGGTAEITSEDYLHRSENAEWTLGPGVYEFWLEIRRGDKRWRSPYRYALRVPPADTDNGHFTLSVVYDSLSGIG